MNVYESLDNISKAKRHLERDAHTYDKGLISVCMANYNKKHYIADSINSVLKQTYRPLEIILVDDCSSDDSILNLNQYLYSIPKPDVKITLERLPRRVGTAWAQNLSYYLARGEYIANWDSDDLCDPTRLARQKDFLRAGNYDMVGCNFKIFSGHPSNILQETGDNWLKFDRDEIIESYKKHVHCVCFGSLFFKSSVIEILGGMNKRYIGTEDFEFVDRAFHSGFKIGNCKDPLYLYRSSTNQRSRLFHET